MENTMSEETGQKHTNEEYKWSYDGNDGSGSTLFRHETEQSAEELAKALEDAVARGDIEIEVLGEKMVVNFTPTEQEEKNLPQL